MISIGIGIVSLAVRGVRVQGWTPALLFANGEQGAWYDPSDLTTLWQDAAGTVPVTADSQPVRLILDKSGRGNHATAPSDAARPLYRTAGGLHWLDFDGVDDLFYFASQSAMRLLAAAMAIDPDYLGGSADLGSVIGSNSDANAINYRTPPSVDPQRFENTMTGQHGQGASCHINRANTTSYPLGAFVYRDGTAAASKTFDRFPDTNRGRRGAHLLYGLVFCGVFPGASDVADLETYLAAKSGVTLP